MHKSTVKVCVNLVIMVMVSCFVTMKFDKITCYASRSRIDLENEREFKNIVKLD